MFYVSQFFYLLPAPLVLFSLFSCYILGLIFIFFNCTPPIIVKPTSLCLVLYLFACFYFMLHIDHCTHISLLLTAYIFLLFVHHTICSIIILLCTFIIYFGLLFYLSYVIKTKQKYKITKIKNN